MHPAISQRFLNNIDRISCDLPSVETPERLTWREIEILRLEERLPEEVVTIRPLSLIRRFRVVSLFSYGTPCSSISRSQR